MNVKTKNVAKFARAVMFAVALVSGVARSAEMQWIDAEPFLQGRLTHGEFATPYQRLPDSMFTVDGLSKVLGASKHGTGLYLAFRTDSRNVRFRYTLASADCRDKWCGPAAFFGIDVYTLQDGKWRWERVQSANNCVRETTQEWNCRRKLTGEPMIAYLPFRGSTLKMEIGIDEGAKIEALPRPAKKVVHYGTSLVHGGCVTRSGLLFTTMYARELGVEVVNLGFSGAAHMQLTMADVMATEDCDLYVVDPALNNSAEEIEERLPPFVKRLRELRPETPILVCEPASTFERETDRSLATCKVYDALVAEGVEGLHLIRTEELMCDDSEGTVDGIHPNAWGAVQMGRAFAKAIRGILRLDAPAPLFGGSHPGMSVGGGE